MARVLYGSEITELQGSIGGITFQRNRSGSISKLKNLPQYSFTTPQARKNSDFSNLAGAWNQLTGAQQASWNSLASANTKTNYWGQIKNLSGYNFFLSINSIRLLASLSIQETAPAYIAPLMPTSLLLHLYSTYFRIFWNSLAVWQDYYILVVASPPLRSRSFKNRSEIRFMRLFSPQSNVWNDFQTFWTAAYGIPHPPSAANSSFLVKVGVSFVHKDCMIPSPFRFTSAPYTIV